MRTTLIALTLTLAALSFSACGDQTTETPSSNPSAINATAPKSIDFQAELKSTISALSGTTLKKLGDVGTFLHDSSATIPLPQEISDLSTTLKAAGQSDLIEKLSNSIQESAANTIQEVQKPLEGLLEKTPMGDTLSLITGADDAITRHLESATRQQFAATVKPALVNALNQSGASDIIETIKEQGAQASGAISALKGMGIKTPSLDLDLEQYVNDHVVDLIFSKMATEEKKLRDDPGGRFAELYQAAKEKIAGN